MSAAIARNHTSFFFRELHLFAFCQCDIHWKVRVLKKHSLSKKNRIRRLHSIQTDYTRFAAVSVRE